MAEAQKFPSFVMTNDLGGQIANMSTSAGFVGLGAGLAGPLIDGGRSQKRVEIELARAEALARQYEKTILDALREVEDSLTAIETYRAEHAARVRQVEAARNATSLTQVRYEGGWTGYLEVLENERSLFSAELRASEALQLHLTSIVSLYKALGGGWSAEPGKQP